MVSKGLCESCSVSMLILWEEAAEVEGRKNCIYLRRTGVGNHHQCRDILVHGSREQRKLAAPATAAMGSELQICWRKTTVPSSTLWLHRGQCGDALLASRRTRR
jgi:hypothetical protein